MQNAQTNFGPLWNGSPQFATKNSLLSTSVGLNTKITTTSNVLQGEIDAIVAGGTTALWANYRAIKAVDLSGHNLSNANTITATSFSGPLTGAVTGNVTGNVVGNTSGTHTGAVVGGVTGNVVGNLSNTNLTLSGQYSITETADVGSALSNYASYGTVNITGKGGLGGIVNITADVATPLNPAVTVSQMTLESKGNYGLITPGTPVGYVPRGGLVSITARQGLTPSPPAEVTSALFANGEIDLTAYSYGVVPGLIKLSAGANAMYAGAFSPITGIFGNNYIAATVANTMTAGLPPSGIPTLVGTNYFFATLGVGGSALQIVGNRMQGGLGVDFIQPYPNGDLIIQSNANGTDTVVISGVKSLAMSNGGNITGVGNINLTTVNGAAYPPVSALNPTFNSVSTNQISTGASFISSINGLPMSAYTNVGDAVFNSISTNRISTGASFISSINGLPISAYTNVGDATFNSVSTSRISTARIWISSINDSIYFTNQPNGNSITGINDLFAQTAVFNTSLASYGTFQSGSILAGPTRVTGLFRVTNGSGFNVATIDTAGAITGTSLAVSGAISGTTIGGTAITGTSLTTGSGAITGGVGSFTNTTASGSATVNNGLTVVAGGAIINGATNIDTLNGVNLTYTTANLTTATIPTANITNTNTGVINAGAGALALTYGSISFNGSPYAPTAGTSSDPTFNSISTNKISTAQVFLSSINGYAYTPGGSISQDPTFNSISTNTISTAQVFLSSINGLQYLPNISSFTNFQVSSLQISSATVTGGLTFSTVGSIFDITNIFTSTTSASYDTVSSITNDILNYQMNLTSLPVSFDMGGFLDITATNRSLWLNKTIIYSGAYTPGQNPTLNLVGAVTNGDFFDVRNTGPSFALAVWNPYESGGFLMNITPGQFYRFTYTTSWAATANPTQTIQTSLNTFSLVQGWNNTILSTNNSLTLAAGVTNILGFAQLANANITDLTAQQVKFSTSQTQTANISSLNVSSFSLGNGNANTLNISTANISTATIPTIYNTNFSGRTLTASSITTSSITGCLFNSLVSTVATKAGIDGATQQLLNASVAIYSPIPTLDLQQLFTFSDANYSYWNNNGFQAGNQPNWFCRIETLVVNTSAQVDFYIGDYAVSLQIGYSPTQATYIGNIASGFPQKVRFYFSGGTWYFTNTFSGTSLDNNNSLTINQNIHQTRIQTTDSLVLSTSLLQIYGDTYLNNLIGQYFNVSTLSSVNVNTGQINAINTTTNAISTNTISTNSITTNTLTTNSLITTAPLTVPSISTVNISSSLITAGNLIAYTRVVTPSISTLNSLNGFNARLINNPGNVLVYTQTVSLGNGSGSVDINTDPFVKGVYTCSAVCRGNVGRTLEATLYYNSRTSLFCENANAFDNYNACWWHAYNPGFVRFTSRTDGPGDTFDIYIYMISGQYTVVGDNPPFPQASTITATVAEVNTGTPTPVVIGLSTMTGSTITIEANRNISILANIAPPSYISTGNITIAGTNSVELIGNQTVVGGLTDVNIAALNGSLYLTGNSTIQMAASTISIQNYVDISGALFVPQVTGLSSINGYPFTGGSSWVGTATSDLDMNGYNIIAGSNQLLSIGTNTTNPNAISFSNYGGVLGDIKMKSYNIDIGDYQNGTIAIRSGGAGYAIIDAGNIRLQGTVDMYNNSLNNIYQLNFSNSANIDGTYANQLNFNASNSYFLGNLRFYGSNRTLDIADNQIYACSYLYGNSGGFLTINTGVGMVIENNQGARQALNSDGSFEFRTTGANKSVYINADALTFNGSSNNQINNVSSINANTTLAINAATINMGGALFAPQVTGLSSINGSPFTGGSSWVGTATSDLDMCNYNINNVTSITSAVATMALSNTSNIEINAPNIGVGGAVNMNCNAMSNVGELKRFLISTDILQPIIQYGQETSSGSSGTVTVTLPQRYTSVSSYLPFACMGDAPAAEVYVTVLTRATFEIGWQNGGGGTQLLNWHTMGT